MEASTFFIEIAAVHEKLDALQRELDLHRRALCTLLALITGQPIMTDALQALLKELGHVPVSPLLVPGAVVGKPS